MLCSVLRHIMVYVFVSYSETQSDIATVTVQSRSTRGGRMPVKVIAQWKEGIEVSACLQVLISDGDCERKNVQANRHAFVFAYMKQGLRGPFRKLPKGGTKFPRGGECPPTPPLLNEALGLSTCLLVFFSI